MTAPIAQLRAELAHDVFRHARRRPLDAIFQPKTVAVIGATETAGSVGRAVMENLAPSAGNIFPIHPKRSSVLGRPASPTIAAVREKVDLAVIVTPAPTVPGIVRECVQAGVPAAIVISAGFKECGASGANEAEFAIVISDGWQRHGLGTQLLKRLVQIGRDERLRRITTSILPDNREMQHVAQKAGLTVRHLASEGECQTEIELDQA